MSAERPKPSRRAARRALKDFLAKRMESFAWCSKHRAKVVAVTKRTGVGDPRKIKRCRVGRRCRSGLCPVCVRLLRVRLLRFSVRSKFDRRDWYFVTVFVDGWTKPPGDMTPFGKLRDHPLIGNLKRQLRRTAEGHLIVIGSIETQYSVVDNVPRGKPFHLHLMISGASAQTISSAVATCLPPDPKVVQSVRIRRDGPTVEDLLRALSYAFKQPFWKKSKREGMTIPRRQSPKPAELAELIANLGVHGWGGRLILVGVRFEGGAFRLTTKLSSTSSCDGERHPHETVPRRPQNPDPRGERRRE